MYSKNRKLIIISSIIIGIDLLTKILALHLLPFQNQIQLFGEHVCFYLTYNMDSTGGQADYLLSQEKNKNIALISSSLIGIIMMTYTIFIYNRKIKRAYKWLIGIGILILLLVISESIKPKLSYLEISSWQTSIISKIAGIYIYLTIFILTKNNRIRLFTTIIISAGIGNLASHFYYPFRIVDFIEIKRTYEILRIGVFNLADLAFDIGFVGLITSLIRLLIKQTKFRQTTPAHSQ